MTKPPLSFYDVFPDAPNLTIVDVGASEVEGDPPPYRHLQDSGRATVFAFEPDDGARGFLANAGRAGLVALPYFIGDGEPGTFHQTNNSLTGSLFAPNTELLNRFVNLAEMTTPQSTSPVQTVRIDDVPEISSFDFLKMDIQGAELGALRGMPNKLRSCLLIQTEVAFVEMYRGQPLFADIDTHLRRCGFQLHSIPGSGMRSFKSSTIAGPTAQWLWGDVFYARDFMDLGALSNGSLLKQAALLNDIVKAPDYSVEILREIDRRDGGERADVFTKRLLARLS